MVSQPSHRERKWPARPRPQPNPSAPKPSPPKRGIPMPRAVVATSRAPVAINSYVAGNSRPRITSRNGRTIVSHRELVATIIGQGASFAVNNGASDTFPLNPLEPATFKWLSVMAGGYDSYNILNCCLEYVPLCSTTFTGRVGIFYDRDSSDVGPFDRNELANFASLVETSPWAPATLQLPDLRGERFMKDVSSDDAKVTDAGRIGWATYNTTANDVEGDLFICYEVELINAQPASSALSVFRSGPVGSVISGTGPRLVLSNTLTQAAVSTWVLRLTTGTYFVNFITDTNAGVVTASSLAIAGDANFVGTFNFFAVSNANRASASCLITVRDTKATLTHSVTGGTVSTWQLGVCRAVVSQPWF